MDFKVAICILVLATNAVGAQGIAGPDSLRDAYALLAFKQEITSDPSGALYDWQVTSDGHPCFWNGVRCGDLINYRVTSLTITNMGLEGPISGGLGGLTELTYLNLSYNALSGAIPAALSSCSMLQIVDFSHNQLSYTIPTSLSLLSSLQEIYLDNNALVGTLTFPGILPGLKNLTRISVESNYLTGYPFTAFLNTPTIQYINVRDNSFSGVLDNNDFLVFGSTLQVLLMSGNSFRGNFLTTGVANFQNLVRLGASGNQLTGSIPMELQNCVKLSVLNLSSNWLTGTIPSSLSSIPLTTLDLQHNILSGDLSPIFSFKNITDLRLDGNFFNGTIGAGIASLTGLVVLTLSKNELTGSIPPELVSLSLLRTLDVSSNLLSGAVPEGLITGTLTSLSLSNNALAWRFPSGISTNMQTLNLASCGLSGGIPTILGNFTNLASLDLSGNALGGSIPFELGYLQYLQSLKLSSCNLSGTIPDNLGAGGGLLVLDLSKNSLIGGIPDALAQNSFTSFSVTYNQLKGQIPDTPSMRIFATSGCLPGNRRLCASFAGKKCPGMTLEEKMTLISVPSSAFLIVIGLLVIGWLSRGDRYSCKFLLKITSDFNFSNVLGQGSQSTVYKGPCPNGDIVAVKRMRPEAVIGGKKNFAVECKVLMKVNHPNIVKVKGWCASKSFMAMVLEYMPNGSLNMQLKNLNWSQRLDAAAGVAQAIAYLHGEWRGDKVLLCDIKPGSVLLNEEFRARLTGIRLSTVAPNADTLSPLSSPGASRAPGRLTMSEDVYNYGMLLLEIVTSQSPEAVEGGLYLYVRHAYPDKLESIIDPKLFEVAGSSRQIIMCLNIGLHCADSLPGRRPSMQEVLIMFESVYSV